uniref:40S ribosomal protein S4 n=1 Tax=Bicosoecida sp. CB-2014 TaxID=1486930 RepID=A0A7S1CP93_9STRA|mmetsp:Transcript_7942/g.28288  ORF Transcript_7942/g.28288 Transcript_7942/m.28288 type:complete len:254 (+) Transcript_7942:40-801(+)|eukprot:CAMPEP_0203806238 /NCGR_PEP_ID=MMETSP0115-20131106/227_1 /ASSEMBLY_ACC=CAM_ASM_000227 /TAXON_ID=33651 /ORGANISM="Bicosoecid sp, Strain ms1" /LENGTH=253 /DNA_ID=CAMNT_0050714893 /DNA_START=30 /DNA_END=791 /DNA_ORIENTATION=-
MARGPKKHLKRLHAPKHWMLDKMGGIWAPRPATGPHKLRESLPLIVILRNRLKYALTRREVQMICMQKLVQVDGRTRTDPRFPAGFMDVVSMEKSADQFRLMYDTKGRFVLHRVDDEEAAYKLARVKKQEFTSKAVPYIVTHDGRTIRYHDPTIKVLDTVKIDLATGKVVGHLKFEIGSLVMITGGRNTGRVGTLVARDRHPGSFDIVHVKDAAGHTFATRLGNLFVIGTGGKAWVSLPKGEGIKKSIMAGRE